MKWVWLIALTSCAGIKSVRVEPEHTNEIVTVGEPLEPVLPKTSPYWWVLGGVVLLWYLRKED